jgi:hypothetical protein
MKEVFSKDKADIWSKKADIFWDKRGQVNKRTSILRTLGDKES